MKATNNIPKVPISSFELRNVRWKYLQIIMEHRPILLCVTQEQLSDYISDLNLW